MTNVHLCPVCGSGKVEDSETLSDSVVCRNCGWYGTVSQTVVRSLDLGQTMPIVETVATEYLSALASFASVHIGRAMVASGLVAASDRKALARLIKAATMGAHKAALDEVDLIQKEIKNAD